MSTEAAFVPSDAFQQAADTVKKLKTSPGNKELLDVGQHFPFSVQSS
jgi:acyl-CoA-binding protein